MASDKQSGEPGEQSAGAADADHQVTPARAILTAPTVEDRIDHIADLMSRFDWVRGKTGKQLAAIWGLSVSTVEGNAAEASRRITADREEVARDVSIIARRMLGKAEQASDFKGVKAMGDLLLDVSGARAPTKVESTNINTNAEATPAEASRLVREAFGEHAARKAIPNAPEPGDLSGNASDK